MMHQAQFREDLFYRLNVFPIHLPPLRERLEDIPLLAEQLLQRHGDLSAGRVTKIAPSVISDMMNYHWRGNVRELENLLKRAIIKTEGDTITRLELPGSEAPNRSGDTDRLGGTDLNTPFKEYLATITQDAEQKYLVRMLRLHKGNINHIARLMDVDRKTVYRKMAEHSLDPSTYRE
jgi:Nif-specific regulatory protein